MSEAITRVVHVVDDDAAIRDSLSFLLETAELTPRTYATPGSLLDRVGELEPGCIVTDVRMPGMSGLELVVRLKELGVPHPVIVLTGHADVALAIAAMKAGVTDFLEKPVDDEALLAAVHAALAAGEGEMGRRAERAEIDRLRGRRFGAEPWDHRRFGTRFCVRFVRGTEYV